MPPPGAPGAYAGSVACRFPHVQSTRLRCRRQPPILTIGGPLGRYARGAVRVAALLVGSTANLAAQPATPSFETGVTLVEVAVATRDREGRHVAGLQREDFVLEVDGRRVPIETFAEVRDTTSQPAEGRFLLTDVFVYVIDPQPVTSGAHAGEIGFARETEGWRSRPTGSTTPWNACGRTSPTTPCSATHSRRARRNAGRRSRSASAGRVCRRWRAAPRDEPSLLRLDWTRATMAGRMMLHGG
jgi:hypothetical protein